MPIRGLTDRVDLSFPYIGDIRKGAKKTEATRPGADLTFFRAVFSDQEKEAAGAFFSTYGAEPREINIILPFPEPDRNFEAWQEEYTAGALQHRCDGQTCVLWRDGQGEIHHDAKPCPGGCKPVGRLKVIVPELRRLAFVIVHTTSVWDIQEIMRNLAAIKALTRNGVSGIPLVLKRRPREISTPWKDGKRARRTKWLLSIEADPKWVDRKLQEMERLATPGMVDLPALAAPEITLPDADADTDAEEYEGTIDDEDGDWSEQTATPEAEPVTAEQPTPTPTPAPAAKAQAQPAATYAPKPRATRPITDAALMRAYLREKAGWTKDSAGEWHQVPADEQRPPDDKQVQRLASVVAKCFHEAKDAPRDTELKRYSVYRYVFGRATGHAMEAAEVEAMLLAWGDKAPGREYAENEYAWTEVAVILAAAMVEAGQTALPLEPPVEELEF